MGTTTILDDDARLEKVCKELDDLTLLYLSKLNQYTQSRVATSDALQKGYLDLAHAKYTMGAKAISHLSYDERMKAQVDLLVNHNNQSPYTLTRLPAKDDKESTDKDDSGLRQRKEKGQTKDTDSVTENKGAKKKVVKVNGNPLHWFGLLVSPSLRTCQNHFQAATTHLVDLANMVHDLNGMEQQYQTLKEEKSKLLGQQLDKTTVSLSKATIVE
ncbi:hypothetical protein BC941DRAFT_421177 [Chlamydoabsidia padenii]|nr:hypothetical protein BC941DRAFT_421177 [Chlamydoabsidia padenii]